MTESERPALPGYGLFLWMFWMQPLKLHAAFIAGGIAPEFRFWDLLRHRRPNERALLYRMCFVWFINLLSSACMLTTMMYYVFPTENQDIDWGLVVGLCLVGIPAVVLIPKRFVVPVAFWIPVYLALGTFIFTIQWMDEGPLYFLGDYSVPWYHHARIFAWLGLAFGLAKGVDACMATGVAPDVMKTILQSIVAFIGLGFAVAIPVAGLGCLQDVGLGIQIGVIFGKWALVDFGFAFFGSWLVTMLRLPFYLIESVLTLCLALRPIGGSRPTILDQVPMRAHDLIYLPLPGLTRLVVRVGQQHPEAAGAFIAEAAVSLGQKQPARLALAQLRCAYLSRAGIDRAYREVVAGEVPFFQSDDFQDEPWSYVRAAARALHAASQQDNPAQKRQMLDRALRALEEAEDRLTTLYFPHKTLLRDTLAVWRAACDEALADLDADEAAQP